MTLFPQQASLYVISSNKSVSPVQSNNREVIYTHQNVIWDEMANFTPDTLPPISPTLDEGRMDDSPHTRVLQTKVGYQK